MNKLILINGYARSGKDTFTSFIRNTIENIDIVSSIDPIKSYVSNLISIEESLNKNDKLRIFLSEVKDSWIKFNDGPFKYITSIYDNIKQHKHLITHIREIPEIIKLKNKYNDNCITLFIERNKTSEPLELKNKWKTVSDFKYDYYINNNSTLNNLKNECAKFCEIIK